MANTEQTEASPSVWDLRRLGLPAVITTNIPKINDVRFWCNSAWSYIQIINNRPSAKGGGVSLVSTSVGWTILLYGDRAMSVSVPHDGRYERQGRSMLMDAMQVAIEIAALAQQRGWKKENVQLIAGTKQMQRLVWGALKAVGIVLQMYTPNDYDLAWYKRNESRLAAAQAPKPAVAPAEAVVPE